MYNAMTLSSGRSRLSDRVVYGCSMLSILMETSSHRKTSRIAPDKRNVGMPLRLAGLVQWRFL